MEEYKLRQPVQKRAIQKRKQILEYGFKLICEKGYHNVDCIDIAKASNVSTGTVYQYFKNKRDIFLQGLQNYSDSLLFHLFNLNENIIKHGELFPFLKSAIDNTVNFHTMTQSTHEEILAMKHSDSEVNQIFQTFELKATDILVDILTSINPDIKNIHEKSHLIIGWIDSLCHELAYHKHSELNHEKMTELVINSIIYLLNN